MAYIARNTVGVDTEMPQQWFEHAINVTGQNPYGHVGFDYRTSNQGTPVPFDDNGREILGRVFATERAERQNYHATWCALGGGIGMTCLGEFNRPCPSHGEPQRKTEMNIPRRYSISGGDYPFDEPGTVEAMKPTDAVRQFCAQVAPDYDRPDYIFECTDQVQGGFWTDDCRVRVSRNGHPYEQFHVHASGPRTDETASS